MNIRKILAVLVAGLAFALMPSAASAQTRTWVSGVGDDLNPCSRTAPCKTFAGAINKTAANGEINCLDPGGYGAVNITKSITIDCRWTHGSILAANVNGIIVNGAGIHVILRGITINGASTTTGNGIRFIQGASLTIEDVVIENVAGTGTNGAGVRFEPGTAARFNATNSSVTNTNIGVRIQPTGAGGNARVHLENVTITGAATDGLRVDTTNNTSVAGIVVDVENSQLSGGANGVTVVTPVGTNSAIVNVNDTSIFNNPSNALSVNGANSIIRVSGSTITTNGSATSISGGGTIASFGDNRTVGNSFPPAFTPPPLVRN
jgi:hypothetical protein